MIEPEELAAAMQRWGVLEDPAPEAAHAWIRLFLDAYGASFETPEQARAQIFALREESCVVPALELERLRSRDVLFFLDSMGQYVDGQAELRNLPVERDVAIIAGEFGIAPDDALYAARMALTGEKDGPPLNLLFPLLGHDRILIRLGAINSKLLHGRGLEPIKFGPDGKPFAPIEGKRADGDR